MLILLGCDNSGCEDVNRLTFWCKSKISSLILNIKYGLNWLFKLPRVTSYTKTERKHQSLFTSLQNRICFDYHPVFKLESVSLSLFAELSQKGPKTFAGTGKLQVITRLFSLLWGFFLFCFYKCIKFPADQSWRFSRSLLSVISTVKCCDCLFLQRFELLCFLINLRIGS